MDYAQAGGVMAYALIIDDYEPFLDSFLRLAASEGLVVARASSWEEGLARCEALWPQVVIADYNLPGSKHGLQLLLQIKSLWPAVKVILLSGVLTQADLVAVEGLGLVDAALPKTMDGLGAALAAVREAKERHGGPVNWRSAGQAHAATRRISPEKLEELDRRLSAR